MTLKAFFNSHKEVAVAFSGGVDSAALLCEALKYADRVGAYYVKSAFQPEFELNNALKLCKRLNTELNVIELDVFECDEIISTPKNRCYYCKNKIFSALKKRAKSDGFDIVVDGTNASDDASDRPGMKALSELNVLSPLRLCSIDKKAVRRIAKENSLFVYDLPSYSCLATRIPTQTPITEELLDIIETAENKLFDFGFSGFRVRWLNGDAKIELLQGDFQRFFENRNEIYNALKPYFNNVLLDLKARYSE
ncbi:MAG: ATP-dependent sacrificial sulfur transferase LarE [Eubacterium sp.]